MSYKYFIERISHFSKLKEQYKDLYKPDMRTIYFLNYSPSIVKIIFGKKFLHSNLHKKYFTKKTYTIFNGVHLHNDVSNAYDTETFILENILVKTGADNTIWKEYNFNMSHNNICKQLEKEKKLKKEEELNELSSDDENWGYEKSTLAS